MPVTGSRDEKNAQQIAQIVSEFSHALNDVMTDELQMRLEELQRELTNRQITYIPTSFFQNLLKLYRTYIENENHFELSDARDTYLTNLKLLDPQRTMGIASRLREDANAHIPHTTYGNEEDANLIFGKWVTIKPETINKPGAYILTPSLLIQNENEPVSQDLYSKLATVFNNNPATKNIRISLQCHDAKADHYRTVVIDMSAGKIQKAVLFDPAKKALSTDSQARKLLQDIVKKFDPTAVVKLQKGNLTNASDCLFVGAHHQARVTQDHLERLGRFVPPAIQTLAKSTQTIRATCIQSIREHLNPSRFVAPVLPAPSSSQNISRRLHASNQPRRVAPPQLTEQIVIEEPPVNSIPPVRNIIAPVANKAKPTKQNLASQQTERLLTTPVKIQQIKKAVSKISNAGVEASNVTKKDIALQIKFDEIVARKYEELLSTNPRTKDEVNFEKARQWALSNTQLMFKSPQDRSPSDDTPPPRNRIK